MSLGARVGRRSHRTTAAFASEPADGLRRTRTSATGGFPEEFHQRPRQILAQHFPDLVGAPINETRACHYESSVDQNFIVDTHPEFDNVWLAGGGSSEGFKFGPVLGEYIARRVLEVEDDPVLAETFRLKDGEFGEPGSDLRVEGPGRGRQLSR